jgi:spore coat polysaccharide biosynthesis protein SpsF
MLKVGIITQARMTSTRLPGKVLMEAGGKTLLEYHIERLQWSGLPVFIATTVNTTDDCIVDFAKSHHIEIYRGDEQNVLNRYYECAHKYGLDILVRVTSDCPLIDGYLIKEAVEEYLKKGDSELYISNGIQRTFPRGFDFEVFSFKLLEDAQKHAEQDSDKEHVTPYIHQNRSGKVKIQHFLSSKNNSDIRITVDTQEDYQLVKILLEEYHAGSLTFEGIVGIFEAHPALKLINAHIEQKKI